MSLIVSAVNRLRRLRSHPSSAKPLALLGLLLLPLVASAAVAVPSLSTPSAGSKGYPFQTASITLSDYGYVEQEFLMSGTAQAYTNAATLGTDGRWQASPGASAAYVTRLLVRRPSQRTHFNGVVVVEWLNVTGGVDATPEWDLSREELLREGYAWVGVSAQYAGAAYLKSFDAQRYASISHPGDSWSYDIYSQAAAAILKSGAQPLGSLSSAVRVVLAVGESQSAFRLLTYYNAVQPLAKLYQGFLIHSTGFGAPLSQSIAAAIGINGPQIPAPAGVPATADISVPASAWLRNDLKVPVLLLNTETDLTVLGAAASVHQQPDHDYFRLWEVAGTAHADAFLLERAGADAARSGLVGSGFNCGNPAINNGPQTYAARAALHATALWTRAPLLKPRIAPRISVQWQSGTQPTPVITRDAKTGNAIGGIRLPPVDVPLATFSGERPPLSLQASPTCILFGSQDGWNGDADSWDGQAGLDPSPTPEPVPSVLYGSKAEYLRQYQLSVWRALLAGYLLPDDSHELLQAAQSATLP